MAFFPITQDVQAFLLRATASLERIYGAVADTQRLVRNADALIGEVRQILAAFQAALGPRKELQ